MKVICIGTLDKFSRFFLKLSKELSLNNEVNSYTYSINFSGFLYNLLRFRFSSWISMKTWLLAIKNNAKYKKIIKNQNDYKNIKFKKLIKFHLKLNKSISEEKLLMQSLAYIDYIENVFLKKKPDLIILIGDSRLCIQACILLADHHKVKTYFIEQGPFNTTIFDEKGVNANASIRQFKITDRWPSKKNGKEIFPFINRVKPIKYFRSPIYRGLDFLLDFFLKKSNLYPPDLKYTDTFPKFRLANISKKSVLELKNTDAKIYLLILQVPMDVNMILHSPNFKNHYSIVKKIHKNLPENSKLILREHPIYKNKYETNLYEYSKKHGLTFDTNKSLNKSFDYADVIIVNNSTVGIEAIAMNKTVVVLGDSYYDNPKLCIKYNEHDDLKLLLNNALNFKPNNKYINTFLNEFLFNYLIEGYITDKNLMAAKTISNKIKTILN